MTNVFIGIFFGFCIIFDTTNSGFSGVWDVPCHLPCLSKILELAKREMNSFEDISDPTDFENASLRALDMAIRCSVCKEVVNNPVMAPCGHSFCSLVSPVHCATSL